jgi:uncharacterized protein (TIGR04255 family)
MPGKKLKHAPLKEAIFELFWKLPLDATNFPVDPDYDMALGKFGSLVEDSFPVQKRLSPPNLTFRVYPKPAFQFWKGELEWPVLQLGPGVLTVNDTEKNYIWDDNFRPAVVRALEALERSYAVALEFIKVRLTYIDAFDYDLAMDSPASFVARNLRTSICTEYELPGQRNNLNINQTFTMSEDTLFHINIQNGQNNASGAPAIIWTTAVERMTSIEKNDLLPWLDWAHKQASDFFVKMLNPDFYDSFDR